MTVELGRIAERVVSTAQHDDRRRVTSEGAICRHQRHVAGLDSRALVEQLVEATKETVRVNNIEACYIRPLIYLGYGEMGLNPLPCTVNVSIAVWPWGTYLGEEASVSARRREVQRVMDLLNEEIAGRYRQGRASVDELLAAQRTPPTTEN